MKILHLSWGLEPNNGAANIARMIIREQSSPANGQVNEVRIASKYSREELAGCDELWCHCGWYWRIWIAVWQAKRLGKRVKWMPECCYDPLRVQYHGWKKRLVGPIERWALRKVDALVATCEEEGEWCRAYLGKRCPKIEITDIKRFFRLDAEHRQRAERESLHVLYLGRPHPLKGVRYLREAVKQVNQSVGRVELREVSDHTGDALEADWAWADVFCLPTLSDNFGLVVAEALERGLRVITTDGAPAWRTYFEDRPDAGRYLKGFRDGDESRRVKMLVDALQDIN